MRVPNGHKKFYGETEVLLLDGTLYGLTQAAMSFWKELLKTHEQMNNSLFRADPCSYYNWSHDELIV